MPETAACRSSASSTRPRSTSRARASHNTDYGTASATARSQAESSSSSDGSSSTSSSDSKPAKSGGDIVPTSIGAPRARPRRARRPPRTDVRKSKRPSQAGPSRVPPVPVRGRSSETAGTQGLAEPAASRAAKRSTAAWRWASGTSPVGAAEDARLRRAADRDGGRRPPAASGRSCRCGTSAGRLPGDPRQPDERRPGDRSRPFIAPRIFCWRRARVRSFSRGLHAFLRVRASASACLPSMLGLARSSAAACSRRCGSRR